MTYDPTNSRNMRAARNLETRIGNLAHQLLATEDYEQSVEIASALVAAIRDLIDERGKLA